MHISTIRLHQVTLPLVHSFQTSSHRKSSLTHILVEASDKDGNTGWGEIASPTDPFFCGETTHGAWDISVRHLVPRMLGAQWEHPSEIDAAFAKIRGNEFAKAGFIAAAWALWATASEIPLAAALGATRSEVAAGVSLGIEPTIDALLAQVDRHLSDGYRRVKLKIAPGWDIAPVRAVRAAYPDADLHVDANGAYPSTPEAAALLAQLDEFGLTMIEQPFSPRDFLAHAALQSRIATPICLDESVVDVADLATMIHLDAGRVLNIKVSRMGGLTQALAAHDAAQRAGIPVWCGGMHEFGVGRAANVALSALPGFTLPSDVSGSDKYFARDVITAPVVAVSGMVTVPQAAGLGFEVDREWIAANRNAFFDTATAR
ncbi:O-succinylbenzoate synthase [Rarobacter incanus]|uniref:o-succinylbenzoate synthase n=1 Tax=Rarobacter incanus TaxID=153494 RepID=A0A542SNJ8_9MICO|nr:O-succinylbenzoate synthase [Rarobacter incanus]